MPKLIVSTVKATAPTPALNQLGVTRLRVRGEHILDFSWTGATTTRVDIYVNGLLVSTVRNAGSYTYFTRNRGGNAQYVCQVCEVQTGACSNEVTVRV